MMVSKTKTKWEYGDFQTPNELAILATSVLRKLEIQPETIVEPSCGKGSLLLSAVICCFTSPFDKIP